MRKKKIIQEFVDRLLLIRRNAILHDDFDIQWHTELYMKAYKKDYNIELYGLNENSDWICK